MATCHEKITLIRFPWAGGCQACQFGAETAKEQVIFAVTRPG